MAERRLFVWDFDDTVLCIHSFALRVTEEEAARRSLEDDVADLSFFRSCVKSALEQGHLCAVATFGLYPVVQAYLDRICPGVFSRANISTPSCVGVPDGFSVPEGKTPQLELLRQTLCDGATRAEDVSFFDDDPLNITRAVAAGYTHSFLVPRGPGGGFTRSFCASLSQLDAAERLVLVHA